MREDKSQSGHKIEYVYREHFLADRRKAVTKCHNMSGKNKTALNIVLNEEKKTGNY